MSGYRERGATPRTCRRDRAGIWLLYLLIGFWSACGGPKTPPPPPEVPDETPLTRHHLSLNLPEDGETLSLNAQVEFSKPVGPITFWLHESATPVSAVMDGNPSLILPQGETDLPETRAYLLDPPAPGTTAMISVALNRARFEPEPDTLLLQGTQAWYPRFSLQRSEVSLEVALPKGHGAIAQGQRQELPGSASGRTLRFEPESQISGLTFYSAPLNEAEARAGEVVIRALLREEHASLSDRYLQTIEEALSHYSLLLSPYPLSSYTLVEAPVGGMYAYEGFCLIDPEWLVHAYGLEAGIQHEILHTWFGYFVRPGAGGNWAEGLVTYLADHRIEASRGQESARRLRKHFLRDFASSVHGIEDLTLTAFSESRSHGSESVGYAKAAMVFHMLKRRIGNEAFYQGLQRFLERFAWSEASWDDLILAMEGASGDRLAGFSADWLERTGAPSLRLISATNQGGALGATSETAPHEIRLVVEQSIPAYELTLPVTVTLVGEDAFHTSVALSGVETEAVMLTVPSAPLRIEIDPGFEVFRALNPDEAEPTIGQTHLAIAPVLWRSPSLAREANAQVDLSFAAALAERYLPQEELPKDKPALLILSEEDAILEEMGVRNYYNALLSKIEDPSAPHVLVFALPSPERGGLLLVIAGQGGDLFSALSHLSALTDWSYAVFENHSLTRQGHWMTRPESLSWSFSERGE